MPDLNIRPLLANWFAQDPLLCLSIVACFCAAIYGMFDLDRQGEVDWFSDGGDRGD